MVTTQDIKKTFFENVVAYYFRQHKEKHPTPKMKVLGLLSD
jgi:hypothetical protein